MSDEVFYITESQFMFVEEFRDVWPHVFPHYCRNVSAEYDPKPGINHLPAHNVQKIGKSCRELSNKTYPPPLTQFIPFAHYICPCGSIREKRCGNDIALSIIIPLECQA